MTGYTFEMLKPCMIKIIHFMQQNLQIDKLKYFDVDQVQHVKNYNVAGVTE